MENRLIFFGIWIFFASLVSFALCAYDKTGAVKGGARVAEKTLLISALIGGAPGLLLGMKLFRHKTKKQSFQAGLGVILLLQIVLLVLCNKI